MRLKIMMAIGLFESVNTAENSNIEQRQDWREALRNFVLFLTFSEGWLVLVRLRIKLEKYGIERKA